MTYFKCTNNSDFNALASTKRMHYLHLWSSLFTQLLKFAVASISPGGNFLLVFVLCITVIIRIIVNMFSGFIAAGFLCHYLSDKKRCSKLQFFLLIQNIESRSDRLYTHPECPRKKLISLCRESVSAVSAAEIPAVPSASSLHHRCTTVIRFLHPHPPLPPRFIPL